MPDVRMPDGTIIRNVPEGMTKSQLQAKLSRQQAPASGGGLQDMVARSMGVKPKTGIHYDGGALATSKLTLGISDRVVAGADALMNKLLGKGGSYAESQAEVDRQKAAYKEAHPGFDWATLPLNLMGGGPKAAEAIAAKVGGGLMRQAAGTGALYGGVSGLGSGRGSAGNQAEQLAASTALGGAAGPIAAKVVPKLIAAGEKYAVPGIQQLARLARRQPGIATDAAQEGIQNIDAKPAVRKIIQKTLAAQGMTPRQAGKMLDDARGRGVPLALMDTGDEMRGLASALARKPGDNRTIMRDAVVGRQEGAADKLGQLDRVQGAIKRDLGPVANVRQTSEQMMADARTKAAPLYDRAYQSPVVSTPEIESLLATPAGRQALGRARGIAANERRDPAAMGFALDADGNVVLNPVNASLHGDAASARSAYDDAVATAKKGYDDALVNLANERRRAQGGAAKGGVVAEAQRHADEAQQAFEAAVANTGGVTDTAAALGAQPTPGMAAQGKSYTTHTLDYVKRGLDDVVESMRDPVTGRLRLDEAGRAINDVRAKFVRELDRVNPDYAAARAAYAGPAQLNTALARGAKIGAKDGETIWAETRDMTPPELDQYKLGVRSALSKALENRVDAADKIKALVGTPKKRAVLNQLFGGADEFERFMATMADEQAAAATHARVATGSPTAPNLADDAALDGLGGIMANAGNRALGGQGMIRNALGIAGDVMKHGSTKSAQVVRSQLASGLSETDPVVLAARLREMARANAVTRFDKLKAAKRGPKSSAGGGIAAGGVADWLFNDR